MHSTTFYTCASISTDTIHVHSNARRYWLAALSIWILKKQHHKRGWPWETRTRRRVILDLQSLPSGGRTIPPPLASTRADMPRPSAGAPWHLTRHTCDVASTPCQHRCQGHHVAVTSLYKGTQPLITIIPISITLPPFSRQPSPKHIQGPPWGTHQVTQQKGYLCSNQALLLWQT